jgi:hypothetical protein
MQFAEGLNCAGLPLGGRSFSRVLLPLRGLQSPLVRAAMPVGQTGRQSRCTGCVNSYHHFAETARLSTITFAAWAKSSLAARCSTHGEIRLPAPARKAAQPITGERRCQSRAAAKPRLFNQEVRLGLALREVRLHPARRRPAAAPFLAAWAAILGRLLAARMLRLALG